MMAGEMWISKRWERDNRYYEAHLKRDLFGWIVARNWGRIGTLYGRRVTSVVESYDDGLILLSSIGKTRHSRSYRIRE